MAESQISSQAFYAAELRSERVRIFGVLFFLGVVAVVLTVRVFLLHTTVFNLRVGWNLTLAVAIGLYEYVMLRMVDRALRANQEFPRILWITRTILETAVPAIGVAWLTTTGFESAYRPLAKPRHTTVFRVHHSLDFAARPVDLSPGGNHRRCQLHCRRRVSRLDSSHAWSSGTGHTD